MRCPLHLELDDTFPEDNFRIREDPVGVGIPDTSFKTSRGILCIDPKSPTRGSVRANSLRALGAVARGADPDGVLLVLGPVERPRDEVVQGEVGAPVAVDAANAD